MILLFLVVIAIQALFYCATKNTSDTVPAVRYIELKKKHDELVDDHSALYAQYVSVSQRLYQVEQGQEHKKSSSSSYYGFDDYGN